MHVRENTTITVCGCGALGCLLASRLIDAGLVVQGYQRAGAQLDALRDSGFTLRNDPVHGERTWSFVAVSDDTADLAPTQLVIVLVKTPDTTALGDLAHILTEDGVVLTLQNGLGNAERLATLFDAERIALGIDTYGAYRIAPGIIGWGGDGYLELGPLLKGRDMNWVADVLCTGGLNATYKDDPAQAIWTKLALNLMTNPLTALTGRRNGELTEDPDLLALMKTLATEAVLAAGHAGIRLEADVLWDVHLDNLRRTAGNRSSMLQDVEAGRPTEIDAITGALLDLCPEPLPCTATLHHLIRGITQPV